MYYGQGFDLHGLLNESLNHATTLSLLSHKRSARTGSVQSLLVARILRFTIPIIRESNAQMSRDTYEMHAFMQAIMQPGGQLYHGGISLPGSQIRISLQRLICSSRPRFYVCVGFLSVRQVGPPVLVGWLCNVRISVLKCRMQIDRFWSCLGFSALRGRREYFHLRVRHFQAVARNQDGGHGQVPLVPTFLTSSDSHTYLTRILRLCSTMLLLLWICSGFYSHHLDT